MGKVCRNCHESKDKDLIAPCRCTGNQKWVHRSCLDTWRTVSPNFSSFTRCDMCHFEYRVQHKPVGLWPRIEYVLKMLRDIIITIIAIVVIVLIFGCVCLLIERVNEYDKEFDPEVRDIFHNAFFQLFVMGFLATCFAAGIFSILFFIFESCIGCCDEKNGSCCEKPKYRHNTYSYNSRCEAWWCVGYYWWAPRYQPPHNACCCCGCCSVDYGIAECCGDLCTCCCVCDSGPSHHHHHHHHRGGDSCNCGVSDCDGCCNFCADICRTCNSCDCADCCGGCAECLGEMAKCGGGGCGGCDCLSGCDGEAAAVLIPILLILIIIIIIIGFIVGVSLFIALMSRFATNHAKMYKKKLDAMELQIVDLDKHPEYVSNPNATVSVAQFGNGDSSSSSKDVEMKGYPSAPPAPGAGGVPLEDVSYPADFPDGYPPGYPDGYPPAGISASTSGPSAPPPPPAAGGASAPYPPGYPTDSYPAGPSYP